VRVTDSLVFQAAIRDTGRARERAQRAMEVAATGSRVSHPGDDPAAAGMIEAFGMSTVRLDAVARSAGLANSELQAADGALDGIGNALSRARELAVALSNAGNGAAERGSGALAVGQLLAEVVARANTRFGNRWVFGGNRDGAPPFDVSGSYLGDAGIRQVEIAPGVLQDASVRADVALKGVGGGVDVLGVLQGLQAALAANDLAGIQAALPLLETSIGQLAQARVEAGLGMDAFATATEAAKMAATDERTRATHLGEVDLIESSIELTQTQRALEASLSASAQSFRLTLLDYLR